MAAELTRGDVGRAIEDYGEDNDKSFDDHLPELGDAEQHEAISEDADHEGADERAANGATPAVVRLWEIGQLSLSSGSIERTSLLAELRKNAAVPSAGHYEPADWEGLRVAEGSATL